MATQLIIILLLFVSCQKNNYAPSKAASEYFPNTIGDYWEYSVYDSSMIPTHPRLPRNYPVKVSIIGTKQLVDNKDAVVWQYSYPDGNDLRYIRIVGDTVKIYDTIYSRTIRDLQFPRQIFIIPFKDSNSWQSNLLISDIYSTTFLLNAVVQNKSYDSVFKIYEHYIGPNIDNSDTYWFKPNIGRIQIYYNDYNLAPKTIQLWQLKKYYLK